MADNDGGNKKKTARPSLDVLVKPLPATGAERKWMLYFYDGSKAVHNTEVTLTTMINEDKSSEKITVLTTDANGRAEFKYTVPPNIPPGSRIKMVAEGIWQPRGKFTFTTNKPLNIEEPAKEKEKKDPVLKFVPEQYRISNGVEKIVMHLVKPKDQYIGTEGNIFLTAGVPFSIEVIEGKTRGTKEEIPVHGRKMLTISNESTMCIIEVPQVGRHKIDVTIVSYPIEDFDFWIIRDEEAIKADDNSGMIEWLFNGCR